MFKDNKTFVGIAGVLGLHSWIWTPILLFTGYLAAAFVTGMLCILLALPAVWFVRTMQLGFKR